MTKYSAIIHSAIGKLGIICDEAALSQIHFLSANYRLQTATTRCAQDVCRQLARYFKDPEHRFDLALTEAATSHQRHVRKALSAIPLGKTRTYGELADKLQSSPRAVGQACRCNPLPIVIPCHRVVSKTDIGGFAGKTSGQKISIKQWLLDHENTINC